MNNISINNYRTTLHNSSVLVLHGQQTMEFTVCRNGKNEPETWIGSSSVVFKLDNGNRFYALKCYITDLHGRWHYLNQVKQKLQQLQNNHLVNFDIYENALAVTDDEQNLHSCSVLLMPWIEGERLANRVKDLCSKHNSQGLKELTQTIIELACLQINQNYSHGDITPENILVTPEGKVVLIDHDTFGFSDVEKTTSNPGGWNYAYQHPYRHPMQTDIHADEFSFLLLIICLKTLEHDPGLYKNYNSSKGLLFSIDDFKNPFDSKLVKEIEKINDSGLQYLLKLLLFSLHQHTTHIPGLFKSLKNDYSSQDYDILDKKINELKQQPFLHLKKVNSIIENKQALVEEDISLTTPLSTKKIISKPDQSLLYQKRRSRMRIGVATLLATVTLGLFGLKAFFPKAELVSPENYNNISSGIEMKEDKTDIVIEEDTDENTYSTEAVSVYSTPKIDTLIADAISTDKQFNKEATGLALSRHKKKPLNSVKKKQTSTTVSFQKTGF